MKDKDFIVMLLEQVAKRYEDFTKITIEIIDYKKYRKDFHDRYEVDGRIDTRYPIALVTIDQNERSHLVFIDMKGHGHFCDKDVAHIQKESAS